MNYKKRCIPSLIIGLVLVAAGFVCMMFGMVINNKILIVLAFIFTIVGVGFGRPSVRGLMCISVFNRKKAQELQKLEAIFSGGGITQEEYYARKIQLLNAEYDNK